MKKIFHNTVKKLKLFFIRQLRPISLNLELLTHKSYQKEPRYFYWLNENLARFAEEFFTENNLEVCYFLNRMGAIFNTAHFKILTKRWIVDYYYALFNIFHDYASGGGNLKLALEDNPLNKFAVKKYSQQFGLEFKIAWNRPEGMIKKRMLSLALLVLYIIFMSLKSGIKLSRRKRKFKIMREAIWGLYDTGGYFFHDDFLVDHEKLKKEELLLFSRVSIAWCDSRLKASQDAKKSGYAYFYLPSLPIGITQLFFRVIAKYIIGGFIALASELRSLNFSLFKNIYWYFIFYGLAYEKIFSNFEITSELGHNYFSANHIAESIICKNYGTKYYLMHWSDNSVDMGKYISSFLGCDYYLAWGEAHIRGVEGNTGIIFTGYPFKFFVKKVVNNRVNVLREMKIAAQGKIITFFDESFGSASLMTEVQFMNFWRTALKTAMAEKENTVVIKPKDPSRYKNLSQKLKEEFIDIKKRLEGLPNAFIIDSKKWSFVEAIGISDIVITQCMTSSATIAIICGIEGLYMDEARYNHPFSALFKNRIVFTEPDELRIMISRILKGEASPLKDIPEELLRQYDQFSDDRGLALFRDILTGMKKRIGIIIQARMGSTRLPGKVMLLIEGKPLLQHIFDRLGHCRMADEIILATTINAADDMLADLAKKNNLKLFRGSEEDVLSRYYLAAKESNLDVVVRITADCPVIDPEIIDKVIDFYLKNQPLDYVSNTIKPTLPRGLDVEVFSFRALETAYRQAKLDYEREHVTPYISLNPLKFKIANFQLNNENYSHYRWTVDTKEDFELIDTVYKRLYTQRHNFCYSDILKLFAEEPGLIEINQHIKQKAIGVANRIQPSINQDA